ncbi:MAG TPA: AI-2E family transporter [Clostridiales bacterium]|nr:AI-2E family transporter [Clostridiales bacterium]
MGKRYKNKHYEYTIFMKGINREFINRLILITLAALIVWNYDKVATLFSLVKDALTPIFIGAIFAMILNVPMQLFENKVFFKFKKLKKPLSLWSSVLLFAGILTGFGFLIFSKLVESIKTVSQAFQSGNVFQEICSENAFFNFIFTNLKKAAENFMDKLQDYVPKMMEIASNVLKVAINIFLGLFFAILILNNKEELSRQFKKLLLKVSKGKAKAIMDLLKMALEKFSRYMGGQLIEAMLLGIVCYTLMILIGLPFAPLVSAIIALVNLIPMVGAYIGGAFSALIIFSVSPEKALIFIIFIIILQQVEAVTTYPVIVGKYVGLSGFWILASVVIGGSLFGFIGVFLAVPVMAFLHDFIGGLVAEKKAKSPLYLDGA